MLAYDSNVNNVANDMDPRQNALRLAMYRSIGVTNIYNPVLLGEEGGASLG